MRNVAEVPALAFRADIGLVATGEPHKGAVDGEVIQTSEVVGLVSMQFRRPAPAWVGGVSQ